MKVKELRIGNYINGIYDQDNELSEICRVVAMDETGSLLDYQIWVESESSNHEFYYEFNPILLNAEWLEKFGFIKNGILYEKEKHSQFALKEWIVGGITEWIIFWGDSILHKIEPKYIHELQNLYFVLTGEDLKIK